MCVECEQKLRNLFDRSKSLKMPKSVELYTTVTIDIAHMLPSYNGKCKRIHGHSIKCEIWVYGPVDEKSGMLVDFKELRMVADQFDHFYLNDLVSFEPTAENLARFAAAEIFSMFTQVESLKVRVHETESSYAEVSLTRGEYDAELVRYTRGE